MKFGIDINHNGGFKNNTIIKREEFGITKELEVRVMNKLKLLGHTVVDCTPEKAQNLGDYLYKKVLIANQNNLDYFLSIKIAPKEYNHMDIFATTEEGIVLGEEIMRNFVEIGFDHGNIKDGNRVYVLKNTRATGILIELNFQKYDRKSCLDQVESISEAIVMAIISTINKKKEFVNK